jgi:hypothetical protein
MSEFKILLEKEHQLEVKDQKRSAAITGGIAVVLILSSLFWTAMAGVIPPIGEPSWKTIGMLADFGNHVEGSGKVNNFEDPSPTPADRPKTDNVAKADPKTNPANAPKVIESNTPSNTTTNASNQANNTTSNSNSESKPANTNASSNPSGGSNDGKGKGIGNQGDPAAKVLNEGGMFAFGNGIGGSAGRRPLKVDLPNYNVQQEARIKFSFIILPDGKVALVKPEATPYADLAKVGKDAIEKWRFSEVDEGEGNLKTSVTITFRLK